MTMPAAKAVAGLRAAAPRLLGTRAPGFSRAVPPHLGSMAVRTAAPQLFGSSFSWSPKYYDGHISTGSRSFSSSSGSSKVFIVCSNPVGGSFSNAIADSVQKGLESSGKEVRLINLYSMPKELGGGEFVPLLSQQERVEYFKEGEQSALTQDLHVKYIVESLRWCDSVVLVYPTWWFNIPGILKGMFDRCFVPGVGFKYDPVAQARTTGLKNIKKVGVCTTYGFTEEEVVKAGDAGRMMISTGMTMLFAPDCQVDWKPLYGMQGTQPQEVRAKYLEEVTELFSKW